MRKKEKTKRGKKSKNGSGNKRQGSDDKNGETRSKDSINSKTLENLLETKYIFGYRGDFKNNIFLLPTKQQIIYPAGNNIVKVSYETGDQKSYMDIKLGLG